MYMYFEKYTVQLKHQLILIVYAWFLNIEQVMDYQTVRPLIHTQIYSNDSDFTYPQKIQFHYLISVIYDWYYIFSNSNC